MIPGNPLKWPKLSEDLPREGGPGTCQCCGIAADRRWREHDHMDRPTDVVIVLCDRCSDEVIERHPRLYSELERHEPAPGTMPCCMECVLRIGVVCRSPLLKANGGDGLPLRYPEPGVMHVDFKDKQGRRRGRWARWFSQPVECDGRDFGGEA